MPTVLAYGTFYGKRRDGVIVAGIIPQFDGSAYGSTNCGACAEAMRVASQQKGVRPSRGTPWFPTGASIRRETGDTSGGLNPGQTTRASYAEYGVSFAPPRIDDWSDVLAKLWAGYAVDLLVRYGPIDDVRSGSPGFRGNHRGVCVGIRTNPTTGVLEIKWADPLYDGRRAGIPLGPKWIAASTLRRAAGLLDMGGGTTVNSRYGLMHAYFIPSLTRVIPNRKFRATVKAGTFWMYTVDSSGRITGRTAGRTGGFSASCTAPQNYFWPGHGTYSLVRLTSGSRAGKYIAMKYARAV